MPAEGNASFSNYQLAAVVIVVPWLLGKVLPFKTSWTFYFVSLVLLFLPLTAVYWVVSSKYGARLNEKVPLPGKPQSDYFDFLNDGLKRRYTGKKIPMQIFHDAYFDGKVEFEGDVLEVMEYRHDWASFEFTPEVGRFPSDQWCH